MVGVRWSMLQSKKQRPHAIFRPQGLHLQRSQSEDLEPIHLLATCAIREGHILDASDARQQHLTELLHRYQSLPTRQLCKRSPDALAGRLFVDEAVSVIVTVHRIVGNFKSSMDFVLRLNVAVAPVPTAPESKHSSQQAQSRFDVNSTATQERSQALPLIAPKL